MKIAAIIQARTGSKRLPEKVLKTISNSTVLTHVIERVKLSKNINEIIIATTENENDTKIELEAIKSGVTVFRGSEEDVLSRYFLAAKKNQIDLIVRITSDCPLIDPCIIDEMIDFYLNNDYDIVSNAGSVSLNRTYPRGLDTEIFSFNSLEDAYINAKEQYQREHVTPYMYEKSSNIFYYKNQVDYSNYRWTLDTEDDFVLISEIYNQLFHGEHNFFMKDIIDLFKKKPELLKINAHVEQKKLK